MSPGRAPDPLDPGPSSRRSMLTRSQSATPPESGIMGDIPVVGTGSSPARNIGGSIAGDDHAAADALNKLLSEFNS